MLKEHQRKFLFALQIIDALAAAGSWLTAYYIRFHLLPGGEEYQFLFFLNMTPIVVVLTLGTMSLHQLYDSQRFDAWYRDIIAVISSTIQTTIGTVVMIYLLQPTRLSRGSILLFFLILTVGLVIIRIVFRNILIKIRRNGKNLRFIMLVGHGEPLDNFVHKIQNTPDTGLRFMAWFDSNGKASAAGIEALSGHLHEQINLKKPDAIVLCYTGEHSSRQEHILRELYDQVIPVIVVPNLSYSLIGSVIEEFQGIPLLKINQPRISITMMGIKRFLDFSLSLIALLVLMPLLAILAIGVKLSSPGPVFYGQKRMTRNGSIFTMWKFRSMRADAENDTGAVWAQKDDPRKTRFGAFLRKTSLDELPQLWNILRGDMSIVGPRPERPELIEKFKTEIPGYMLRHKMKAGLTGWAQANGWRGNTSLEKRIEFDIFYIKNWSLMLDVKIVFLTVLKGFINKNAY